MRILVFGHKGALGRCIWEQGLARGHEMLSNCGPLLGYEGDVRSDVAVGKVYQRAQVDEKGLDAVINAVAIHDIAECNRNPLAAWDVNCMGALRIAQLCLENACMVQCSTDYAFGADGREVYGAYDPVCPTLQAGVYGASKAAAELAVESVSSR
jgi:dTDP-4-dehydrorhamnose reductase